MGDKLIECAKCGRLIPIDEVKEHSKWHSEIEPPKETITDLPKEPIVNEPPMYKPMSKSSSKFGLIMFAMILILVGVAFLFGFVTYWPLILVIIGLVLLVRMIVNLFKREQVKK